MEKFICTGNILRNDVEYAIGDPIELTEAEALLLPVMPDLTFVEAPKKAQEPQGEVQKADAPPKPKAAKKPASKPRKKTAKK